MITGDVKHDAFIEAKSLNIALIDAGHYETEKIYMPCLLKLLKEKTDLEIVLSEKEERPYLIG